MAMMHGTMRHLAGMSVTLLLSAGWGAAEPAAAAGSRAARLHAIGSSALFTTVNQNDAKASLKVWVTALGNRLGFAFDVRLDILESMSAVSERLAQGAVDVLILDTPDYLSLSGESRHLEAIAVRSNKGAVDLIPYQLLTRDSDGPRKLEQLRGKRIAIASRTHSDMGLAWLETQLADGKLGPARDFFESISLSYKGSSCVLPLFFGKVDACVLDARSYQLMQELNPQLSKLKVLASSEPLLEGLVAMPKSGHRYRAEIIDAIMTLHRDPAGAQMVMFFQSGAMLPAKAHYFDATRALWERYLKLGVRGTRSSQADRTGGLP